MESGISKTIFNRKSSVALWIILISAIVFFFPFLGSVHLFDWDEINFAESAREMILTGDYIRVQIDFKPFWEKPPLFFWFQVLSMKLFGITEYAARFPNAVFGVITLLTVYFIGKHLHDKRFGFIWALAYLGSFLPHLYFKSGIIDPSFNYFIFVSVFFMARATAPELSKSSITNSALSGFFIGLAILTKGPVGFLLLFLTMLVYWISSRFKRVLSIRDLVIFGFAALIVSFFWYGFELIKNGPWFLEEFIVYQIRLFQTADAGHAQPFYYHFLVVFIGCFPLSAFALVSLFSKRNGEKINFRKWMIYLFWVVMILFTIVKTKIVHYSSMAYLPLSYLAAAYLYDLINSKLKIRRYVIIIVLVLGTIFSLLLTLVPLVAYNKEKIIPYIKDKFAVASLQVPVEWSGFEFLIGTVYLALVWYAASLFKKQKTGEGILTIFYSTALCIFFYMVIVVPKIEAYSQRPAIEFYKSIAGNDVYVRPVGFKSYAHYFYFQKPQTINPLSYDQEWLLTGNIDKPAYFVAKIHKTTKLDEKPDIRKIGSKGGFAFYVREPVQQKK